MRNPLEDPQPGDVVAKTLISGRKTRTVCRREGGDVWYTDENGKEKNCWITTWAGWCVGARIVKTVSEGHGGDGGKVPDVPLQPER